MENTTRVALAALLLTASVMVVTLTRVGPVVLVLSEEHGHGVHLGDLVTLPMGAAAAVLLLRALRRS